MERWKRSAINLAKYNPRQIDKSARRRLKENLKKGGLVCPLVVNRRTCNLISGHQRIGIIDEEEGNSTYEIDVAVIDVDDAREKELNVFLNNVSAMGSFDFEKLADVLGDLKCDQAAFGFDTAELHAIVPNSKMFDSAQDKAAPLISEIEKIKAAKAKTKAKEKLNVDYGHYVVLVFGDVQELDSFLKKCNLPTDNQYIDGRTLAAQLGIDL